MGKTKSLPERLAFSHRDNGWTIIIDWSSHRQKVGVCKKMTARKGWISNRCGRNRDPHLYDDVCFNQEAPTLFELKAKIRAAFKQSVEQRRKMLLRACTTDRGARGSKGPTSFGQKPVRIKTLQSVLGGIRDAQK